MVYTAEEFIAAITLHIPKKAFQTIRYYAHYSNKSRGLRAKPESPPMDPLTEPIPEKVDVIDVSKYQPKNVPSLTWRECIKKIWKQDQLICPECLHAKVNVSFIVEPKIIKKILNYLDLWKEESSRDPLVEPKIPDEIVYVPIEDAAWEQQESPGLSS